MTLPSAQLLVVFYAVSELWIGASRRSKTSRPSIDRNSLRLLATTIGVSISLGFVAQSALRAASIPHSTTLYAVGLVVFGLGLLVRWVSILWLGRLFTVDVSIAADHKLVTTGPYAFVRHPSYTGIMLSLFGLGVCMENWVALLLVPIPPFLALCRRIGIEERALLDTFGDRYREYERRTKRLMPFVY